MAIRGAATFFGPAGFRIRSRVGAGRIEAEVDPPARRPPAEIHLILRHPRRSPLRAVRVGGKDWKEIDPAREAVTLKPPGPGRIFVEAEY